MPPKPAKASSSRSTRKSVKVTPKKAVTAEERLRKAFTTLCKQIDGSYFERAVKTCDKILALKPNDADAIQTKLFLLLQTEQYTAALALIGEGDHASQYAFEKAYSLYRLQREDETANVLDQIKGKSAVNERGVLHLEAQMNYRKGSYQSAFDIYNQLLDTAEPGSEEHSDILTNVQASQKQLDFINHDFLQALDKLPTSISSNIENLPPPTQTTSLGSAAPSVPQNDENVGADKSIKKVRKSRVPAGITPGVSPAPDPERWVKKSERSTYGQGKKRRGGGGGGATQGIVETPGSTIPPAKSSTSNKGKKKK